MMASWSSHTSPWQQAAHVVGRNCIGPSAPADDTPTMRPMRVSIEVDGGQVVPRHAGGGLGLAVVAEELVGRLRRPDRPRRQRRRSCRCGTGRCWWAPRCAVDGGRAPARRHAAADGGGGEVGVERGAAARRARRRSRPAPTSGWRRAGGRPAAGAVRRRRRHRATPSGSRIVRSAATSWAARRAAVADRGSVVVVVAATLAATGAVDARGPAPSAVRRWRGGDRRRPTARRSSSRRPRARRPPPAAVARVSRRLQILGHLAHLPVAVGEGPGDRGVDVGTVEGRERDHGPAAHRGLVVAGGVEDGGEPGGRRRWRRARRRPPRARGRRDGRSAERAQAADHGRLGVLVLAAGERRHLDHAARPDRRGRRAARRPDGGRRSRPPAPHGGVGIGQARGEEIVVEHAEPFQRAERAGPHRGVVVGERARGRVSSSPRCPATTTRRRRSAGVTSRCRR